MFPMSLCHSRVTMAVGFPKPMIRKEKARKGGCVERHQKEEELFFPVGGGVPS